MISRISDELRRQEEQVAAAEKTRRETEDHLAAIRLDFEERRLQHEARLAEVELLGAKGLQELEERHGRDMRRMVDRAEQEKLHHEEVKAMEHDDFLLAMALSECQDDN